MDTHTYGLYYDGYCASLRGNILIGRWLLCVASDRFIDLYRNMEYVIRHLPRALVYQVHFIANMIQLQR